jgi:hypothetical protein
LSKAEYTTISSAFSPSENINSTIGHNKIASGQYVRAHVPIIVASALRFSRIACTNAAEINRYMAAWHDSDA